GSVPETGTSIYISGGQRSVEPQWSCGTPQLSDRREGVLERRAAPSARSDLHPQPEPAQPPVGDLISMLPWSPPRRTGGSLLGQSVIAHLREHSRTLLPVPVDAMTELE